MLLYIEATAAQTRSQIQNAVFNGSGLYSYAAPLFRKLRRKHITACRKHPSIFSAVVLNENLRAKIFSLLVKKMYLSTMILFFFAPADRNRTVLARAEARAPRIARAASMQFSLRKRMVDPARPADRTPPFLTATYSRRL